MKKFVVVGVLLVAVVALAKTPIPTWVKSISGQVVFNKDGVSTIKEQPNAAVDVVDEGIYGLKVARFLYDVAVDGGTSGATYDLGIDLPAGAVIKRSYFKVITQVAGTGTIEFKCEDASNIKTAVSWVGTAANTFVEGASTGAASAFKRNIASDCNISAVIAGGSALTAGKILGWAEYVVED